MQGAAKKTGGALLRRLTIQAGVLLTLGAASAAYGQQAPNDNSPLRKFEKGVQSSSSQPASPPSNPPSNQPPASPFGPPPPPSPYPAYQQNDDPGAELAGEIGRALVDAAGALGVLTLQRLYPDANNESRRDPGDMLIPFVRYDFYRQTVASNIFALDHRLEAGYGPVAVFIEKYSFYQNFPNDALTIDRQLFLYRMSPSRDFELDVGFGQSFVSGLQRTPLGSFSLPVKLMVSDNTAIEFRPTWSGTMNDYELALHWGRQYGSLKVGYRYLSTTGAYLKGPFAGFALYY